MRGFYGEDIHINLLRGCLHDGACPLMDDGCWAQGLARRLAGRSGYPKDDPFKPHACPGYIYAGAHERLDGSRRPLVVAMNYMTDVAVHPTEYVRDMVHFIEARDGYHDHTFLWLTKRPATLRAKLGDVRLPENVWLGCSVMNQAMADALIPDLLAIPAAHRWISVEPMWGPINFGSMLDACEIEDDGSTPPAINWVVCGCESGPKRRLFLKDSNGVELRAVREMDESMLMACEGSFMNSIRDIRDQCAAAQVPFHVKQLPIGGGVVSDVASFPEDLRIQDRPWRSEP